MSAVVQVHVIRCGCGHQTNAMDVDRAKAAMLNHVAYAHNDENGPKP